MLLVKHLHALCGRNLELRGIIVRLMKTWKLSCPVEILSHSCRPHAESNRPLHPTDWPIELLRTPEKITGLCSDHSLVVQKLREAKIAGILDYAKYMLHFFSTTPPQQVMTGKRRLAPTVLEENDCDVNERLRKRTRISSLSSIESLSTDEPGSLSAKQRWLI
jgi:hypothetical protein